MKRIGISVASLLVSLLASMAVAAEVKITPANPPDLTVSVALGEANLPGGKTVKCDAARLKFDPPEIREMTFDAKAPRNFASSYEFWDPWPGKDKDGALNTITLKPIVGEDRALLLGGLFRMVIPESVVVTSADGIKTFKMNEDYKFNADWGQIANLNSRLGKENDAELKVSWQYVTQRLDLVQVGPDGKIGVKKGTPVMVCPALPEADAGCAALAGIYIAPWKQDKDYVITAGTIYPIRPAPPVLPVNKDAIAATRTKLAEGKEVKIAFVGDSITAGAEAPNWDVNLWTEKNLAYVSRVVVGLKKLFPKATITPLKATQGGTQTKFGQDVMASTVLPAKPDLLFIAFGTNDSSSPIGKEPGNPPDKFKEDLRAMIKKARGAGTDVILVIAMPQNPWLKSHVAERWPVYRQAMLDLAREENVGAADVYTEWQNQALRGTPPFSQLHNWINHPGQAGHKLFADVILRFFE
jgi:lysophospholipase L1-like esterase